MILSVNCRALLVIATWVFILILQYSDCLPKYLLQIVNSECDTCSASLPPGTPSCPEETNVIVTLQFISLPNRALAAAVAVASSL